MFGLWKEKILKTDKKALYKAEKAKNTENTKRRNS